MYRYTEEDRDIIAEARKRNKDKRAEKRLYALELRAAGKSAEEVAAAAGFCPAYISQLSAKYEKGGIEAIAGNHYGGNRRNMKLEEEQALLEPFQEKAKQGQIVEVSEIKARYEEKVGHVLPYCNTDWTNVFLRELSKEYPDDMILLCCDGAAWHKSKGLIVPENIELFFIPPYTPEMNPIEQIWKELRKRGFKNELFASLANVINRLCDTINSLTADVIKSITGRDWILKCFISD